MQSNFDFGYFERLETQSSRFESGGLPNYLRKIDTLHCKQHF